MIKLFNYNITRCRGLVYNFIWLQYILYEYNNNMFTRAVKGITIITIIDNNIILLHLGNVKVNLFIIIFTAELSHLRILTIICLRTHIIL